MTSSNNSCKGDWSKIQCKNVRSLQVPVRHMIQHQLRNKILDLIKNTLVGNFIPRGGGLPYRKGCSVEMLTGQFEIKPQSPEETNPSMVQA